MSTPISNFHIYKFVMSSFNKGCRIISCLAERDLCPELTLVLGKIKKTFPMQEKLCDEHFYKPNRVYEQSKTSFYHKKIFLPQFEGFLK